MNPTGQQMQSGPTPKKQPISRGPIWVEIQKYGVPPKMDGENNGNPIKMDDLGYPYFWKHPSTCRDGKTSSCIQLYSQFYGHLCMGL